MLFVAQLGYGLLPDQSDLRGCCQVLRFKEDSSAFKVTSIRLLFLVRGKGAGCKRLGVLHYCWSLEKVYIKHPQTNRYICLGYDIEIYTYYTSVYNDVFESTWYIQTSINFQCVFQGTTPMDSTRIYGLRGHRWHPPVSYNPNMCDAPGGWFFFPKRIQRSSNCLQQSSNNFSTVHFFWQRGLVVNEQQRPVVVCDSCFLGG